MRCFLTLAAEGVEDEYTQVYVHFDDSGIDFDTPGEYILPGILLPPDDDLYAFDIVPQDKPLAAALTIYAPAIPHFYASYRDHTMFLTEYYYSGDLVALTLHRSDDGGESWYIYWQPGDEQSDSFLMDYNGHNLTLLFFDPAELLAPTLFVFEVGEGVGSDILYIDTAAIKSVGQGGNRDSGDRLLLPWEFFLGNPVEDGGIISPPDTGGETGNQGPGDSNGASDPGGKNNAPTNLADDGAPASQPKAESAVYIPPDSRDAVMPVAVNADASLPIETALVGLPDGSLLRLRLPLLSDRLPALRMNPRPRRNTKMKRPLPYRASVSQRLCPPTRKWCPSPERAFSYGFLPNYWTA